MYQFYNPYQSWQYQQPQFQSQPQQPQTPTLNGKLVGSMDEAQIQDVPIGSIGYYPKGDGSEIYCKSWQNDGTTRVDVYERKTVSKVNHNSIDMVLEDIQKSIQDLTEKIDTISSAKSSTTYPINKKKKEVETDE